MGAMASVVEEHLMMDTVKLPDKVDVMVRTVMIVEAIAAVKEAVWTWGASLSKTSSLCRLNKFTLNKT